MKRFTSIGYFSLLLTGLLMLTPGCVLMSPGDVQSDARPEPKQNTLSVDVAVAREGSLQQKIQYVGTTFPLREVSLRSRLEGQILNLNADVGDRVEQGQTLVQIDNLINQATVLEVNAELEALRSEVTSLQADVNEGLTQIKQRKITLQQARSDLARSNQLVEEGAVTQQSAEQAQNTVDNALQALESAQQQLATRSSAVDTAQRRVKAQSALVAQEQQRESFSVLTSPVTGLVLERILEPGDLAQVGNEVLRVGDFRQIKVKVQISELERGQIRVGQQAQVQLDAFPNKTFLGEVTQISLAADATSRLIPVEITIPNVDRQIGRGLMARVSLGQQSELPIVIPETAVQIASDRAIEISDDSADIATIFMLKGEGKEAKVSVREVKLGDRADFQVEILSGLEPGEKFVVRSSGDLRDGDRVRLSFLSES